MKRPRDDPAVAAIVAGPGGDQDSVTEPIGESRRQHGRGGAAGALHKPGE